MSMRRRGWSRFTTVRPETGNAGIAKGTCKPTRLNVDDACAVFPELAKLPEAGGRSGEE
jgi:hypothetical protein